MAKTLGIIGGMTPESTTLYYDHIIHSYQAKFDNYAFPEIIIYSVSFQNYVDWMNDGEWDKIASGLSQAAQKLHQAGADFAVIATNTMHHVFSTIQRNSKIPILSIVDVTGKAIQQKGLKTVGLLGTRFTMQKAFYPEGFEAYGISLIVPDKKDQNVIHDVIFNELGKGIIKGSSKDEYLRIIDGLHQRGCEGIILGCTEIPLLIQNSDCDIPLFNTSILHAESALVYALTE